MVHKILLISHILKASDYLAASLSLHVKHMQHIYTFNACIMHAGNVMHLLHILHLLAQSTSCCIVSLGAQFVATCCYKFRG